MERITHPLTAEEVSLILNISESTVKKLARNKELPCIYVKSRPRFNLKALIKYFEKLERRAV
jgi:excisionase family DNA binding protein